MIVATWLTLVTEEMDLIVILLNKLQAVALVPALGEDIEGNLSANRESEKLIAEFLLQLFNEGLAHTSIFVIPFKFITFFS